MKLVNFTKLTFLICLFSFMNFSIPLNAQHAGSALNMPSGTFSHVTVPDDTNGSLDIHVTNGFTIEAWVKPTEDLSGDHKFFAKAGPGFPLNSAYILGIVNGKIVFEVYNEENQTVVVQYEDIAADRWMHIAATYKFGGKQRIYVNGEMVAEKDALGGTYGYNLSPLVMGVAPWNTGDKAFLGDIDEIRYWQTELSAETIDAWMLKDITDQHPNYNDMTVYQKYNDGSGATASDSSPSGADNAGTLINNPGWVTSTAPFAGGFFSPEIDTLFDGVWPGKTTAVSDILTINSPAISGSQSIVMGNEPAGYGFYNDAPSIYTNSLRAVWQATVQGTPAAELIFDLSIIDWTGFNTIALLENDNNGNYSNATVINGQINGNTFTVPSTTLKEGKFYTLGFANIVSVETIEDKGLEIAVSPNPSNGQFMLKWNSTIGTEGNLYIRDIIGNVIYSGIANSNENQIIDLDNFAAGIYLLQIKTKDRIVTKKIIFE